ncbi:MAG: SusC/RagA family TonB-linked outer membrane protein [Marinilabiliaceae bacterium]|nr:SusC/RagA family TonB-linked outer membrane protein [Marinilabiliaceae bacterium]
MQKLTLLLFFVFLLGWQNLLAQNKTITGVVTGSSDGIPIPGVSVVEKGTTNGTITDLNGYYEITVSFGAILEFSFIGMKGIEVETDELFKIDVTLYSDIYGLDEVIVSGVADETPKKKLSVSVGKVNSDELRSVPASSAAGALQGKVAGVTVLTPTGDPSDASTILIRGATQIVGSQDPLIIVDGVILEGTLSDINVDDIESIEIVKGASASALYGSRAGNGVIVVSTKRGLGLRVGVTEVTFRSEFGINQLANSYNLATHHQYELASDFNDYNTFTKYAGVTYPTGYISGPNSEIIGSRSISDDGYMDNSYAFVHDHAKEIFQGNNFHTKYISVANNSENNNFLASFENYGQEGIVFHTKGYERNSFRINVDHRISKKIKFSASNLYVKSTSNHPGGDSKFNGGVFFNLLLMQPDVDLNAKNADGQSYIFQPDHWEATTENPLYNLWKIRRATNRDRFLGGYSLKWTITNDLRIDGAYSIENTKEQTKEYSPYDTYVRSGSVPTYSQGYLDFYDSRLISENSQITASYNKQFNKLKIRSKISYKYEDLVFESNQTIGYDFTMKNVESFDAIGGNIHSTSYTEKVISENYFGILGMDFKDRYIVDFMFRYDGSSLFGKNERWNPYYRISGAWRISEEFKIPGIDELKIRGAYGTAGQRPPYDAQYEVMTISNGQATKSHLGNKNLKPSLSKEIETGVNIDFLNRFSLEFVYSKTKTEDQFLEVPLASHLGGWKTQWVNAGTLESNVIEVSLNSQIIKNPNFKWSLNLIYDRIRSKITKLDIPSYQTGPEGQEATAFYVKEGETFGVMYGYSWVRNLSEMVKQLPVDDDINTYYDERDIDSYIVNSDGYVIFKGTEGTINEKPIIKKDADGKELYGRIGDGNPNFRIGFSTNFSFKSFTLYALFDWKNGGDIYNRTAQWLTRDYRHGMLDQYGKASNEKKVVDYYQAFYSQNRINKFWVEDASYLKLRELSLYYSISGDNLRFAKGLIKGLKIGVIGRNLLTITDYTGYDPEVATKDVNGVQYYPFDFAGYPNFRSYSASIEIKF